MNTSEIAVRFAPSPTGPLHIGGVRTALYNYLFAKKHGGRFILRIEDTDQNRFVPGAEDYILESLKWCGIEPDESIKHGGDHGPYRQSERTHIYQSYCKKLVDSGNAYYAFDTPEELDMMRKNNEEAGSSPWQYDHYTRLSMNNSLTIDGNVLEDLLARDTKYVVRLKVQPEEIIRFNDAIRGRVEVRSELVDDKVIFKSDGFPTYHLANVVDDHLMKISHVIRGEEWLPSTPIHVLLYRFLGWDSEIPEFVHLPLILKPEGKGKLSKRDGDKFGFPVFPLEWKDKENDSISLGFREQGYLPAAFINLLAFLGWNPGTEKEVYSEISDLIQDFSFENVSKNGARFDPEKAKWFNQQHIKLLSSEMLYELPESKVLNQFSKEKALSVIELIKERMVKLTDLQNEAEVFCNAPTEFDEKTVRKKWKDNSPEIIETLISVFKGLEDFASENIETLFRQTCEANEWHFGTAMISLRLVLTGKGGGVSLFELMHIIGKEEVSDRMRAGLLLISDLKESLVKE